MRNRIGRLGIIRLLSALGLAWPSVALPSIEAASPPVNIESLARSGDKPWHPKPAAADAPVEAARVRIVDFGNDFLRGGDGQPRHHFHCHRYVLVQDKVTGLWAPCEKPVRQDHSVDVDGDGKLDDVVAYHDFSLDRPFSPVAPWYDTLAGTPRWYGGQAIYQAHAKTSGFSEDGVNQDHDGPLAWPRENWAVFHETYEIYSPYRLAANWLWLKHDFLNGGSAFRVMFDDQSRLGLVLKRYFMGIDSVRFLVRDGRQCYLSEATFRYQGTHTLNPARSRWAKYDPKAPHDIYFDATRARFEAHQFRDVTGVGVYCSKDRFVPAYFGYKWYCFECDAVVHRRRRPSENLAMVKVSGPAGIGEFFIGTTEVPYALWKTIFRQARSNDFVPPSQGFGFDKDGDMGSMDFPGPDGKLGSHSLQEPVTDFTLHDAAAWCNALSELESRTCVYYEDPQFKRPLHEVRVSPAFRKPHPLPKLYVKWGADGYRLPTAAEWESALASQELTLRSAVVSANSNGQTQPTGTKVPNANGLYDMLGNVWELVWTFGDCYDPEQAPPIVVLGGDFLHPLDPAKRSANRYGDRPREGSYNIGLRIVRRDPGGEVPADAPLATDVPVWTITEQSVAKGAEAPVSVPPKLEMVMIPGVHVEMAKHETTFVLWKQVRDWAVANGYETDCDGDMGSMDYWGFDPVSQSAAPPEMHWPDEPVTDITFFDMAVWCNALSELASRRPVYYADAALTQVYKKAVRYRPVQFHFPEDFVAKYGRPEREDTRAVPMGAGASAAPPGAFAEDALERVLPKLQVDADADGFRLPSVEEFQTAALVAGQRYSWGNDPAGVFQHDWLFDNAGGTAHPVGQKKPNALGLYDLLGNVSELSSVIPEGRDQGRVRRLGGSLMDLTIGLSKAVRASDAPPMTWPYCDTGFRVVRQNPSRGVASNSAHPTSSLLRWVAHESRTVERRQPGQNIVAVDPSRFDPLQGKVHRGNLYRNGDFEATGVPARPKVKWEFRTGGPVKSSPVAVDGIVYVGSYDRHVYAITAADGKEAWKHKTGAPVSGSAAVVGGVVYIASEDGCAYALGAKDGKEVWKTKCGRAMAGSPAVAYGAVFIGGGNEGGAERLHMTAGPMVALDAKTGARIWQGEGGPQGVAAIASDGRLVYGVSSDVYGALHMRDGRKQFEVRAGHQTRQFASMTVAGQRVFAPIAMRGAVLCIDPSHQVLWRQTTLSENNEMEVNNGGIAGYEILGDLAVAHGFVLAGCNDGKLYAFSADRGTQVWQFLTNGPVQSSPSVGGQTVYFGSWDGHLYAVNLTDGALRWKLKLGSMPQPPSEQYKLGAREGARIVSSPWLADGAIYVGCDNGGVYAVEGQRP